MKKVTLTFPSYESVWLFKNHTNAINVRIEPKKNRICGLFEDDEVNMAITRFGAIHDDAEHEAATAANAEL